MKGHRKRVYKQAIHPQQRYSLNDFLAEFPDDEACFGYIAARRMPGGLAFCPRCERDRRHYRVQGRTAFACANCGSHFYPLVGTIFEKTTTSLRSWFYAIYLMGSTRCGISAKQLQRETRVTYKTAWRMFRQIRMLFDEDIQLAGSSVEMDETYYGGVRKYGTGRPGRGDRKKAPVAGIVERKGRVVARVIPDVTVRSLHTLVRDRIMPGSTVFTDELRSYDGIASMPGKNFRHRRINHSTRVYVRGNVHTNTIEGFWSLVKRGIGGVYHQVGLSYLQSYLNEYAWRYNRRNAPEPMFRSVLREACERDFE